MGDATVGSWVDPADIRQRSINPFTPSPHNNIKPPHADPSRERRKLGRFRALSGVAVAGVMLPYLEITHTEPLSRRFCLNMQNILWNLFGIDIPT